VKRLLVLNQYYWPGPEATAQLLTDLCEGLAGTYEVTVVAGTTRGAGPGREERNGVDVVRVPSTAFSRARLAARAANYVSYVVLAALRALAARRPDAVLCQTDPPFVGDAAHLVARRFGAPLVVAVQDLYPETAEQTGKLTSPSALQGLRTAVDFYLRRADRVVAISETMRRRLEARGVEAERISVIPGWVDTEEIHPVDVDRDGRFVVMHSGNVGHAQELDTLVEAAGRLGDVEFEIVGNGARRTELERLASGLANVSFRPYRPRAELSASLSSASLHFVGLARGLSGYVVPSRLYGVLAAGRPVLVAADETSEAAQLVRESGAGIVVPPGRPDEVAAAIRAARDGEYDLDEMGRRGRDYVVSRHGRDAGIAAYRDLLDQVLRP
jgi:putative colanic acid biosynthesis glycosyltransferase WcaI